MVSECLDCGSPIRGRSDKKFCDDQCRSTYNNRIKEEITRAMRPVNAILRKNHSILSKLCLGKRIRLTKDDLLKHGYELNFHTHLKIHNEQTYYFCYNYGYVQLSNEVFVIVKK
jgi:predicted nucleic acid-binding Zn ribbon protein